MQGIEEGRRKSTAPCSSSLSPAAACRAQSRSSPPASSPSISKMSASSSVSPYGSSSKESKRGAANQPLRARLLCIRPPHVEHNHRCFGQRASSPSIPKRRARAQRPWRHIIPLHLTVYWSSCCSPSPTAAQGRSHASSDDLSLAPPPLFGSPPSE